jgi:hypothetical protein
VSSILYFSLSDRADITRLSKLEIEDDVHVRAAEMLAEVQVTLDLVCFVFNHG